MRVEFDNLAWDYYPGGFPLPGRTFNLGSYRFGHNQQESDPEITGNWGSHYTAEYWMYDSRIMRRWEIDPVTYPWQSPYSCFNNNPILFADPLGLFGTKKQAKQYKRDNNIDGKVRRGDDSKWEIYDKKNSLTYFMNPDGSDNSIGKSQDGVQKVATISVSEDLQRFHQEYKDPLRQGIDKMKSNSSSVTISSDNVDYKQLYTEYDFGLGPINRIMLDNHHITQIIRNSSGAARARDYFYNKYADKFDNLPINAGVMGFDVSWSVLDALSTSSMTLQFIGTFKINIFLSQNGKDLIFCAMNCTHINSETYGVFSSYHRIPGVLSPNGNIYQFFMWTEPVDFKNYFTKQIKEIEW
jgi:hypothetical protein